MLKGFKRFANLPLGQLREPAGGTYAGRYIPENRLNDENWLKVLELRRPPEDGLYISRREVLALNEPKPIPKKGILYRIAKVMVDYERTAQKNGVSGKNSGNVEKIAKDETEAATKKTSSAQDLSSYPVITDWKSFSPDTESHYLGLEQLESGESLSIIGAGITGLTLAWILSRSRPDIKITIYDKNSDVGGWMKSTYLDVRPNCIGSSDGNGTHRSQTSTLQRVLCESGPRTLLPSHPGSEIFSRILAEIGVRDELMAAVPLNSATNRKALVYNGKMELLPSSWSSFWKFFMFNPLLKGSRLAIFKDLWTRTRSPKIDDESVRSFISRRVGPRLADRMVSAIMRGIYAADADILSARSVARLNRLYYLERTEKMSILGAAFSGSLRYLDDYAREALPAVFDALVPPANSSVHASDRHTVNDKSPGSKFSLYGFPGGIQGVARKIADELRKTKNVELKLGYEVQGIEMENSRSVKFKLPNGEAKSNAVVCTVASPSLFSQNKTLHNELQQQKYSSLAVVNVWVSDSTVAKNWFGVLVPKCEDKWNEHGILGVIFDSSVRAAMGLPDKCGGSTMTVMIGGDLWVDMTEEEAKTRALAGLQQLNLLNPESASMAVTNVALQRNSIPIYEVGHSIRQHRVMSELQKAYNNRVALIGMAFGRGAGVSDCIVDALTIALRFSEQRKLLYPQFFFGHWWRVTKPEDFA